MRKWLRCCSYNPNKLQVFSQLQELLNGIDTYCSKYENNLLLGDFNANVKNANLHSFCNQYKLTSLDKDPTCYKNFNHPSCIELLVL